MMHMIDSISIRVSQKWNAWEHKLVAIDDGRKKRLGLSPFKF